MVDPGRPMSTDYMIPGVPSRRLVFAGIGNNVAVLVYEQGGFGDTTNALVFSYVDDGGVWEATLNDHAVDDLSALRDAIGRGGFRVWQRPK
jgi:hypothetical protein